VSYNRRLAYFLMVILADDLPMTRSPNPGDGLAPANAALQQRPAPRPLPLFLELVRLKAKDDPQLARAALDGLAIYAAAKRGEPRPPRPIAAQIGGAALRDHGGSGAPVVLIPSLINPPNILDLDEDASLAAPIADGRHVLLLDWGPAADRTNLSIGEHVDQLLVPLLGALGEAAALVGYCLGGTMAIAAANRVKVERVATLAAPWHFAAYPDSSRAALVDLWNGVHAAADTLGRLPMEVLQAAFWALDPERTVAKFAHFAKLDPDSIEARRFVTLEDWANEGEPLPLPAARELIEDLFGADLPGSGRWMVGGGAVSDALDVPALHFTAADDRIAPAVTAPDGPTQAIPSGHVGMIVGRKARETLHAPLARWLCG
jgi:polyhydroxyalkanoate synthase